MTFAAESVRWYSVQTGEAVNEVVGANGKARAPTLRDAKVKAFRRSVTSIIREAAAPGLEMWKRKQTMLAALTMARLPNEPDEAFLERIDRDAAEQGRRAADRGKEIHTAIQRHAQCQPYDPKWSSHVWAVEQCLKDYGLTLQDGVSERSFCTEFYGGCADWINDYFVLDFKSKDDIADAKAWDMPHGVQLVAYDQGMPAPKPRRLINVFIGANDGAAKAHEWKPDELPRLRRMWRGLLDYSLAKDGLMPEQAQAA